MDIDYFFYAFTTSSLISINVKTDLEIRLKAQEIQLWLFELTDLIKSYFPIHLSEKQPDILFGRAQRKRRKEGTNRDRVLKGL